MSIFSPLVRTMNTHTASLISAQAQFSASYCKIYIILVFKLLLSDLKGPCVYSDCTQVVNVLSLSNNRQSSLLKTKQKLLIDKEFWFINCGFRVRTLGEAWMYQRRNYFRDNWQTYERTPDWIWSYCKEQSDVSIN